MEPVTHMLTGAVLSRAGLNRRAASMTFAMVVAAEFPDVDTLWRLGGPLTAFAHHRGITHTFVGLLVEAALIVGGFWLAHRLRGKPAKRAKAPVNWAWLYAGVMVALLSHLLLDWTNNYGVRPFFPFNPRWYAGSFVFIFEPVLFAILLLALVMPALFGLINQEVGARRAVFRGRPSAIAALIAIAALYLFRFHEHALALEVAAANTPEATRVFASPSPGNPYDWHTVADTPAALVLGTVNSHTGEVGPAAPEDTLYKPADSPAIAAARATRLGQVFADWSLYPVLTETPDTSEPAGSRHTLVLVRFADARFMYDVSFLRGRTDPPISGSVLLDMGAMDKVVETRMDGAVQK